MGEVSASLRELAAQKGITAGRERMSDTFSRRFWAFRLSGDLRLEPASRSRGVSILLRLPMSGTTHFDRFS